MRITWKHLGVIAALIVVMVAARPTAAKRVRDIYKCQNNCGANQICGESNEVPKMCGPTKNGPWYESTYSCCCCTENSPGNWFYGG